MAPRRAKILQNDLRKLTEEDVICPICGTVLIKPITLPCSHGFCSNCFEAATENSNVVCPKCRVRVGSFLRSATKANKLINEALWKAIQDLFPVQVKDKLNEIGRNYGGTCKMKQTNVDNTVKKNVLKKINKSNSLKQNQTEKTNSVIGKPVSKNHNKKIVNNSEKNDKRPSFVNNLATKEYTCRVLCQNSKEKQKTSLKESQILAQKKNKRMQEITESEMSTNDRSNSIESECLYFKPIDYRKNPPSEGLAPIKVPTRKPNVSPHSKILAPSGQKQIIMNSLESAFARLCSSVLEEKAEICKKENMRLQIEEECPVVATKRKLEKSENKAKKKIKPNNQSVKSKGRIDLVNVCDMKQCKKNINNLAISSVSIKRINFKQPNLNEQFKKALQEKADFELATMLQQTFNQSSKYSTRSSVLKRTATSKSAVKIENIMTPYKVK